MAQTNYTPIQLYYSTTAAAVPVNTNLANGELAINITDGKLYYKDNGGTVRLLASNATSAPVLSFQTSLSGLTPSTATTGVVTLAGTLGVASGGTGQVTLATGALGYGQGTSAHASLAIGTAGQILTVNSGATAPQWSTLSGVAVTTFSAGTTGFTPSSATSGAVTLAGTLATTNGGTGLTSFTSGGVVYASSSSVLATGSALTFDGSTLNINQALNVTDGTDTLRSVVSSGVAFFGTSTSAPVAFRVNSSEAMRLTSSSLYTASGINVGIGTSSPSTKLQVVGTVTAGATGSISLYDGNLRQTGSGTPLYIGTASTGFIQFYNNDANTMQISATGNVGIGTSSPANPTGGIGVEVSKSSGASLRLTNSTTYLDLQSGSAANYILSNGAFPLVLYTNSAERMRIDSAGNVGIGTSSPSSYGKLSVFGTVSMGYGNSSAIFSDNVTGSVYFLHSSGKVAISSDTALAFGTGSGATEKARISSAGGFSVGTTADPGAGAIYATGNITAYYSDARLKTVSGKIENALDKVAQLSGVYYTNNSVAKSFGYDSDEVQVGVLAQEVEAVLPQIVKAAPFDLDQDGNSKSGENYKTVQYERLVPLLIEAINELQAKVKALESK